MQKYNRTEAQSVRSLYARRKTDRLPVFPELCEPGEISFRDYALEQYAARLRKAEEDITIFSGMINQTREMLLIADPDSGDLLYVNDAACQCLLYSRGELLGLNMRALAADQSQNGGTWERLLKAVREEGRLLCEAAFLRKDGSGIPIELRLLMSSHDDKRYLLIAAADLTQRNLAATSLLRVTKSLRTIGKCNESIVHAADENALLRNVCRIIVEEGGYRRALAVCREDPKDALRIVACADHEYGNLDSARAADGLAGGEPAATAISTGRASLIRTHDGSDPVNDDAVARSCEAVLGLPLKLNHDAIGAIIIHGQEAEAFDSAEVKLLEDLASNLAYGIMSLRVREEHRIAEKNLSRTLHEVESIMLTIPDILLRTDLKSNLRMWNRSFETFTGLSGRELKGRHILSFFAEQDRSAFSGALAACKSQEEGEAELRLTDQRGASSLFSWKAVLMKDELGNPVGILCAARDITGHRRAEENERRLQAQLLQSQKMEAIGQLAGGIAHDFNNILTAIIGYGNLVLKKLPSDDALRVFADNIVSAANRAANLTRSLLTFSRKQLINPQPLNVNSIIEGVQKLLRRVIGEDIELITDLQADVASVLVDTGQLEQVLINLAANARDAMPQGGRICISTRMTGIDEEFIRTHRYGKPGKCVLITVADTGTGMAEETRQRIFEPFFTTKDVGKGTGLGLSMAYGCIKQHNGYITAESEEGKGTLFRIYLPAIEESSRESGLPESSSPVHGGAETILLAEDDSAVRRLEKSVLEEAGYTVIEAVDGQDAVDKLRTHGERIELLISDVIMPKRSGSEVFDEAQKVRPGTKALFASGYPAEIIKNRDILARGLNFVSKPISPQAFLKKVREALDT